MSDDVVVDLWRIQPSRGDRFLLCSDGLTNELEPPQITEVLATVPDPQVAADLLVRAARTHGGSDNITVVVVDVVVGEDDELGRAGRRRRGRRLHQPRSRRRDRRPSQRREPEAASPARRSSCCPGPSRSSPSFRDRWRARRKARRAARGRRLITVRTVLFAVILAAIVYAAFYAVRWYDTNAYYVQVNNNELMIYHGRIGGGVLYKPVEVERTGVTTADVPAYTMPQLSRACRRTRSRRPRPTWRTWWPPSGRRPAPRIRPAPAVPRPRRRRPLRSAAATTTTGAP